MIEAKISIVHDVIAELSSDIADLDTLHWLVILKAPDLHHEGLYAKIVILDL